MMKLLWTRRWLSATFALVVLLTAASSAGAQPFAPDSEVDAARPLPRVVHVAPRREHAGVLDQLALQRGIGECHQAHGTCLKDEKTSAS